MGLDNAKLVQRTRFVPVLLLLPSQGERLVRVLPGLLTASHQTIASLSHATREHALSTHPCGDLRSPPPGACAPP